MKVFHREEQMNVKAQKGIFWRLKFIIALSEKREVFIDILI